MARSEHYFIEENEADLLEMLQDMVRVPTVNPPGEDYREMVDLLSAQSREAGLTVEIHQVPDKEVRALLGTADYPRYNLIARWDVGAEKTVHFNAHYDVVPVSGAWRFGDAFVHVIDHRNKPHLLRQFSAAPNFLCV